MAISMPIPSNILVPFFYGHVDNSAALVAQLNYRTLIIAPKLAAGNGTANLPVLVTQTDQAKQVGGVGSILARMYETYRRNDRFSEVWCLPVSDNGAGVAATGSIAVTGPATGSGTLNLYIAGQLVQVAVASADTATAIGEAIEAAINANADLPVTAENSAGTVALTCKWKGLTGNSIDLRANYRGNVGGEATPAGVGLVFTAMANGTTAPSLTAALAALGDEAFDYILVPFTDATSLDAIRDFLGDRWSYSKQLYGHCFTSMRGTAGELQTHGATRNDPHVTNLGLKACPTPPWEVAAALGAQAAASLSTDPALPLQTLPLIGVLPPALGDRFDLTEKQTLLSNGIATALVDNGYVRIERAVTTYRQNAFGQTDRSYIDVETLATLAYVMRTLRQRITQKFSRVKLANDGTRFGVGQAVTTPSAIRAELIAAYAEMETAAIVENREAFKAALIVERDANDPNRVNVLFPPDLVNQLRIFAVLAQFRLQYPQAVN